MVNDSTSPREIALNYIQGYAGQWYIWGGDDPSGFDCSGLVVEYMKSIGLMDRGKDLTANDLFKYLSTKGLVSSPDVPTTRGGLIFYKLSRGSRIIHVEIAISDRYQIGASGGGSHVTSPETAAKANAYIKVRPIGSNPGLVIAGCAKLFDDNGELQRKK